MHLDFKTASHPTEVNYMVRQALRTYYENNKRKGYDQLTARTLQGTNSTYANVKGNVWNIDDPTRIRVKYKAKHKWSVYNTGTSIAYITKTDAYAKRHLRSYDEGTTTSLTSGGTETSMNLLIVGDELSGLTPAGANCIQFWEPNGGIGPRFAMPDATDPMGADQYFATLREWHAREQMQPWAHQKRLVQYIETAGSAGWTHPLPGVRDSGGNMPGVPSGINFMANNLTGMGAWSYDKWRGSGNDVLLQEDWATTQDTTPSVSQNFQNFPEYQEGRRGIMDRWWRRKTRRMPPLQPTEVMTFKHNAGGTIAPWRMCIPGYDAATDTIGTTAYSLWADLLLPSATPTAVGMGFQRVANNGPGGGHQNTLFNQNRSMANIVNSRLIYNRKTDPLGSPCTSAVHTLTVRGNTMPHIHTTAPAAPGAFIDVGPAQLFVKQETYWCVKLYQTKRREKTRPFYADNTAYFDSDTAQYQNMYRTAPAQAAPYAESQI